MDVAALYTIYFSIDTKPKGISSLILDQSCLFHSFCISATSHTCSLLPLPVLVLAHIANAGHSKMSTSYAVFIALSVHIYTDIEISCINVYIIALELSVMNVPSDRAQ